MRARRKSLATQSPSAIASANRPTVTCSPWKPVSVKNVVAKRLVATPHAALVQAEVLVALADDEDAAEDEREREPPAAARGSFASRRFSATQSVTLLGEEAHGEAARLLHVEHARRRRARGFAPNALKKT